MMPQMARDTASDTASETAPRNVPVSTARNDDAPGSKMRRQECRYNDWSLTW